MTTATATNTAELGTAQDSKIVEDKKQNRKLSYKVVPAEGAFYKAKLWKGIKAWLIIYTQDGVKCGLGTPYVSEESAKIAGEAFISKWGEFGLLEKI